MAEFQTFDEYKKRGSRKKNDNCDSREDFISMFYDLFNTVNYKVAILLFILGVLIFSDTFIELFLIPIEGAAIGDETTTKGTLIQLTLMTLGYIIIDLLVAGNIV